MHLIENDSLLPMIRCLPLMMSMTFHRWKSAVLSGRRRPVVFHSNRYQRSAQLIPFVMVPLTDDDDADDESDLSYYVQHSMDQLLN